MSEITRMMNTVWGRGARVLLGVVLIAVGLGALGGSTLGIVIAVIGVVPIAMGVWGRCLLEALVPRRAIASHR